MFLGYQMYWNLKILILFLYLKLRYKNKIFYLLNSKFLHFTK